MYVEPTRSIKHVLYMHAFLSNDLKWMTFARAYPFSLCQQPLTSSKPSSNGGTKVEFLLSVLAGQLYSCS